MKLIFLDIDGVLNKEEDFHGVKDPINEEMLSRLHQVIEKSGAKVIISSYWRYAYSLEDLQEILKMPIFGCLLKSFDAYSRWDEIRLQLSSFSEAVDFVVVDDTESGLIGIPEEVFVHTSFKEGLTSKKAREILRKLG
jgi:hypothetical protein